jgi:hypothetical protein
MHLGIILDHRHEVTQSKVDRIYSTAARESASGYAEQPRFLIEGGSGGSGSRGLDSELFRVTVKNSSSGCPLRS